MTEIRPLESFEDHVCAWLLSGTQFVEVCTPEEQRCLQVLHRLAVERLPRPGEAAWRLVEYDAVSGFGAPEGHPLRGACQAEPLLALMALLDPQWDAPDPESFRGQVRARVSGRVQAVEPDEAGRWVVWVGEEPHALGPDAGPVVRPGQQVRAGEELAGPASPNVLFVLKDMAAFLNHDDWRCRRALRNLFEVQALANDRVVRPVVLLGAVRVSHPDVNHALVPVPFRLPDARQLEGVVDYVAQGLPEQAREVTPEFRRALASGLTGFTQTEATSVLSKLAWSFSGFAHGERQAEVEQQMLRQTYLAQKEAWSKEEVLELFDLADIPDFDGVGGYDALREWVTARKACYSEAAAAAGVPTPKGIVLAGVQGTGKSMCAKVIARAMGLPLIVFKFDRVFSSLVGDSEARLEHALDRVVQKGPCVLLLDEVDKLFSGLTGGHQGDSGVGSRALGRFLTWQASTNRQAFVVMTLNRTEGLPGELLRKGRVDELFFVDLPDAVEREEILRIHLARRGFDPGELFRPFQLDQLVKKSDSFSGAEIEQVVIDAHVAAFAREPSADARPLFDDLRKAAEDTRPLSRLDAEGVNKIRDFFSGRARPVSTKKSKARAVAVRPRRNIQIDRG